MESKKKSGLLKSGAITAFATFLSRILGMLRDIAIASLLGASLSADTPAGTDTPQRLQMQRRFG